MQNTTLVLINCQVELVSADDTYCTQWQFSQSRLGNRAICSSFPSQIVMGGGINSISLMCRQFALNEVR